MLLTTRWQESFTDSLASPRATFVTPSNVQDWAEEHFDAQISLPRGSAVTTSGTAATPTISAHSSRWRRPGADLLSFCLCMSVLSSENWTASRPPASTIIMLLLNNNLL